MEKGAYICWFGLDSNNSIDFLFCCSIDCVSNLSGRFLELIGCLVVVLEVVLMDRSVSWLLIEFKCSTHVNKFLIFNILEDQNKKK